MEMLYKYKDVFSFKRQNWYVYKHGGKYKKSQIIHHFFIWPYHVKEEDRAVLDKEMRQLCYLGILKEGFSAYSSPVMLISRKINFR